MREFMAEAKMFAKANPFVTFLIVSVIVNSVPRTIEALRGSKR